MATLVFGALGTLVGGPVGLAVVAAGALFYFREELGLTGQQADSTQKQLAELRGDALRLFRHQRVPLRLVLELLVLAAADDPAVVGGAQIEIRVRGFPDQRLSRPQPVLRLPSYRAS